MAVVKFFFRRSFQFLGVLLVVFSFYFFFNQPEVKKLPVVNFASQLIGDFFDDVSSNRAVRLLASVFNPNLSAVKINGEDMVDYKLQLVSKGLKTYFQNFLEGTNQFLLKDTLKYSFSSNFKTSSEAIKGHFKDYMQNNKDILEVSFFNPRGVKILGVKYSQVKEYSLSPFLVDILKHKDNALIRGASNGEIVLVSSVKDKNGNLQGFISQTLNPSFFVKILDFLNVGHENLFYMKTTSDSVVVDNFKAYSFAREKEDANYLFQAYKELRFSKEKTVQVNTDGVEYSVGMIVDKNSLFGNILSFVFLIFIVYISVYLISLFNAHFLRLLRGDARLKNKEIVGVVHKDKQALFSAAVLNKDSSELGN